MNTQFAVKVGILVLVCIASVKCQHLVVGQRANEDQQCVEIKVNQTVCTEIYQPVCAKLGREYLEGSSPCDFCSKHGNTEAIILRIGISNDTDFSCKELMVGGFINDDPECQYLFGRTGCNRIFRPYCATVNNFQTYIQGPNKCEFCRQYGNINARVVAIGRTNETETARCTPFTIGTKANDDLGCKYLATRAEKACTLELFPVCAQLDGQLIQHSNKCAFCTDYGNTEAVICECPAQ